MLLLTRIITGLVVLGTWFMLRYERPWAALAFVWYYIKHIVVALFMGYLINFLMFELFTARPDVYDITEAKFNGLLDTIGSKCMTLLYFLGRLFGHTALDALLYGFNRSATINNGTDVLASP